MEAKVIHGRFASGQLVRIAARAQLPSRYGEFEVVAFDCVDGKEHAAIVKGEIAGQSGVPVRIHSECFTGDVMGSLRCDCREQLEVALHHLGDGECGIVLYLRQEGRGIGLANKIRAYALQQQGLDTVEANVVLGFEDDERNYEAACQMLKALGVSSVRLMTNNPRKITALRANGVMVDGRIPIVIDANHHNAHYLNTKKSKSGHLL